MNTSKLFNGLFSLLIIVSFPAVMFSQVLDNIVTDRRETKSPELVYPECFQIEIGGSGEFNNYTYTSNLEPNKEIKNTVKLIALPSVLLRYGLLKNLEARIGTEHWKRTSDDSLYSEKGMGPLRAGIKIKIFEELEGAPETSFLFTLLFPTGVFKESFQPRYIGAEFRFAMQNHLSKRFLVAYNLGGKWSGDNAYPIGLYTLSIGVTATKSISVFAEVYGFFKDNHVQEHMLDCGLTCLLFKNLQADISGGIGLNNNAPDYFLGGGLSVRFPR